MRIKIIALILGLSVGFAATAQNDTVLFSVPGGFYENIFALSLSRTNPNNQIRYTINGGTPTAQSKLYTSPLRMDASQFSRSNIYTIVNTIPS